MKFITQSILLILFFVIFFHGSYAINLQDIIANEDTDQAISMIQNGEYLGSVTEKKGMTAFHLAAYKGNFRVCKEIFLKDSSYMNKFTSDILFFFSVFNNFYFVIFLNLFFYFLLKELHYFMLFMDFMN